MRAFDVLRPKYKFVCSEKYYGNRQNIVWLVECRALDSSKCTFVLSDL